MISLKSKREIEIIKKASEIIKKVFEAVEPAVRPGVTTGELDEVASKVIRIGGGEPAFKGYRGYPKNACISINEEVVHGIPGDRSLSAGDVVSFDIGVKFEGFYADAARTWIAGESGDAEAVKLIRAAQNSLSTALKAYRPGWRIGDLSAAIQSYVESQGFQVVREYVGHGIGRMMHEEPQVPNYGSPGVGPKIEDGLVLAIEPMVTEGHCAVEVLEDGWTVRTRDRKRASHYEDMIVFFGGGYENLTGQI
jgi:methionyl aminopeptidase